MKTVSLMDYEFDDLLEELRFALHCEEALERERPDDKRYGYRRRVTIRLLELLQPKEPDPSVMLSIADRIRALSIETEVVIDSQVPKLTAINVSTSALTL